LLTFVVRELELCTLEILVDSVTGDTDGTLTIFFCCNNLVAKLLLILLLLLLLLLFILFVFIVLLLILILLVAMLLLLVVVVLLIPFSMFVKVVIVLAVGVPTLLGTGSLIFSSRSVLPSLVAVYVDGEPKCGEYTRWL